MPDLEVRLCIVGVGNAKRETKNFGRRDLLLKGSSTCECMINDRVRWLIRKTGWKDTAQGCRPAFQTALGQISQPLPTHLMGAPC